MTPGPAVAIVDSRGDYSPGCFFFFLPGGGGGGAATGSGRGSARSLTPGGNSANIAVTSSLRISATPGRPEYELSIPDGPFGPDAPAGIILQPEHGVYAGAPEPP